MDVYAIITNKVIENLEKGIIPWKKPWIGSKGAYNRVSGKSYSMLNQMLLEHEGEYLTFNQITALGGTVKKGAKSEMVVFFKMNEYEEENEDGETVIKKYPVLRYYRVFHISQVDDIEPLEIENINVNAEDDSFCEVEQVVERYLEHTEIAYHVSDRNQACYNSSTDTIEIPAVKQFINMNEYYSTFFHEIIHSTGHEKRLNRSLKNGFGSESYAKEELIAELGSVFLNNHYGIETSNTFDNSTAYIQSWLKALKDDKKLIVTASTQAEKAANYVLEVA
jgi:antirestriction protein ArdC